MRRQAWAPIVARTSILPAPLKQVLAGCRDVCGVSRVVYARLDGLPNVVAVVDIDGWNGQEGSIVYADLDNTATPIFIHYGVDGTVSAVKGQLVMRRSMYRSTDPESTPSGPVEVSTYRWNHTRLVLQNRTGGGATYSPYIPTDQVVIP